VSRLPGPYTALARQVAGEITGVTDCSWQRESSAVWRLTSGSGGCWYLKRHSSARFHEREVVALQGWALALGPGRVPELAAVDQELLVMVVTAVLGQPVLGARLSSAEERQVYRQAGLLLARLHESPWRRGPARMPAAWPVGWATTWTRPAGCSRRRSTRWRAIARVGSPGSAPRSRPWPATGTPSLGTGCGIRPVAAWASLTGSVPSQPQPSATWSGWSTARGTAGLICARSSSRDTGRRSPPKRTRCWPATPSLTPSAALCGRLLVHHHGDTAPGGGQPDRDRDVPAGRQHDVRLNSRTAVRAWRTPTGTRAISRALAGVSISSGFPARRSLPVAIARNGIRSRAPRAPQGCPRSPPR
jgi:hypothetical protein